MSINKIGTIFREEDVGPRFFTILSDQIKDGLADRNIHGVSQFGTECVRSRRFQMFHVIDHKATDAGLKER